MTLVPGEHALRRPARHLLIVVIAFTLVWFAKIYVGAYVAGLDDVQGLREERAQVGKLAAQLPRLEEDAKRLEGWRGAEDLLLHAASADAAGAWIQQTVSDLIRSRGGVVQTTQSVGRAAEVSEKASIMLSFSISNDGLFELLSDLAQTRPVLIVDYLNLRGNHSGLLQLDDAAAGRGPFRNDPVLIAEIEVSAYVTGLVP